MNRIVEIELGGKSWPMCLTLQAFSNICDRYGDLKSCLMRLDEVAGVYETNEETGQVETVVPEDTKALIEEYTWLLNTLLLGGFARTDAPPDRVPPPPDKLYAMISPGDIPEVQRKVLDCIRIGQSREVGAEAPKNAAGASVG